MNNFKVLIFDCDGTILDTYELIYQTTIKVFAEMFPNYQYTSAEIDAFFGPVLDDSFAKYTGDPEKLEKCIERYRFWNNYLHPQYVKAFPHIKELLTSLKEAGYHLVIVSNKVTSAIQYGLKLSGIEGFFEYIVGSEMLKAAKPDPDGIYQIMEHFSINETWMIGDTKYDVMAGQNARTRYPLVKTIGVTWCKTSREEFVQIAADAIVDDPLEIIKVVK